MFSVTPELLRAPDECSGAPLFVRDVTVSSDHGHLVSAVLTLTAEGLVEARIDGRPATDEVLIPGWTSYEWRLRALDIDVTSLIGGPGSRHELQLTVGNGWYCGRLGWMGAHHVYGPRPGVAAVLVLEFADGARQTVVTDQRWRVVSSVVVSDDLYDGQTTDLTVQRGLPQVPQVEQLDTGRLVRRIGPPIVRHEALVPVAQARTPSGTVLVDFGQNLVGWIRLRVRGPAGHRLVIRHAEVLDHGELALRPLRSARAEDVVVLSGGDDEVEPTFTVHGFRYATIEGWDAVEGSIEAIVVGSDLPRTGTFRCSDPLLTRFHENVVWSLRGNTVGIPTDCPQRDERLGWTGDIAVFAPTACFLYDMTGFLRDWLADLRAEQAAAHGRVPAVVPDVLKGWTVRPGDRPESIAIWSDAAVWVPWALWEASGDLEVLRESYPSMVAHAQRVHARLSPRGVWEGDFQFGDWLDPTAPPDDSFAAVADPDVIASAALYRTLDLVARTAAALGVARESAVWRRRAAKLRFDFRHAYVLPDGRIRSDAPAVYALGIVSGVLSEEDAAVAGTRLAEVLRDGGHRVLAGFAGTPYLCEALTRTGHLDDAYALLMNRSTPSWLGPVERGATTIWERWDSLLDDGSVNPGEMTSFNHYALGAVAAWMHRTIGGLAPEEPGWSRVRIDPRPGGGVTSAVTSFDSPHGLMGVAWVADPELRVQVCVPDAVEIEWGEGIEPRVRRIDEAQLRALVNLEFTSRA